MRFIFYSFIVLIFFVPNLFGQNSNFSIVSGLTQKAKKRPSVVDLIKVDNNYFLVRKEAITGPRGFDYFIEKYDENMNYIKTLEVSGQEDKRERIIEGVFQLGNSIAIAYSIEPPKVKKTEFKLELINPQTLTSDKKLVLFSLPKEVAKKSHYIEIEVSENGNYFTTSYVQTENYSNDIMAIFHFSHEGEFLTNLLKTIAEKTQGLKLYQTLLSDDGKVYLVLSKADDVELAKKWMIFAIEGEEFTEYIINTSTLLVDKVKISEGQKGGIVGAATYSSTTNGSLTKYADLTKGWYTFRINTQNNTMDYSDVHPFSYNFVFKGWNDGVTNLVIGSHKAIDKKEYKVIETEKQDYDNFTDFDLTGVTKMKDHIGFENFVLSDVVDHDGEILVIGYIYSFAHFTGLLYTNFATDGSTQYEGKVGIYQYGVGQEPYFLMMHDGSPAVVFQDSYKSTDPNALKKAPYYPSDGSVYGAVVFDDSEAPARQIAFRKDEKPKIKAVLDITQARDKSELMFIMEVAGEGYKFSRIR